MNYFTGCATKDEVRARYRELEKKYHPDLNSAPDATRIMQEINAQYMAAFARAYDAAAHAGERARESGYQKQRAADFDLEEKLRKIIEQVVFMENVRIERIGDWIWIYGVMIRDFARLRTLGFQFSQRLNGWYYMGREPVRKRDPEERGEGWSLDDMRDHFGSSEIETRKQPKLTDRKL